LHLCIIGKAADDPDEIGEQQIVTTLNRIANTSRLSRESHVTDFGGFDGAAWLG
jgi:hypothetical protein